METLKFNTQRMYTDKGQRIAAALLDNGDIYFSDIDRHIDGTISANGLTRDEILGFNLFSRAEIMRAYDHSEWNMGCGQLDFEAERDLRQKLNAIAKTL